MIILRIDLSFKQYNTSEHYNKDTDKTFYNFMVWSPHINKMDIPGDNPEQKTFHSSAPHTHKTKKKKKKKQGAKFASTVNTLNDWKNKYEGASAAKHKEKSTAHSNITRPGTVI